MVLLHLTALSTQINNGAISYKQFLRTYHLWWVKTDIQWLMTRFCSSTFTCRNVTVDNAWVMKQATRI